MVKAASPMTLRRGGKEPESRGLTPRAPGVELAAAVSRLRAVDGFVDDLGSDHSQLLV